MRLGEPATECIRALSKGVIEVAVVSNVRRFGCHVLGNAMVKVAFFSIWTFSIGLHKVKKINKMTIIYKLLVKSFYLSD